MTKQDIPKELIAYEHPPCPACGGNLDVMRTILDNRFYLCKPCNKTYGMAPEPVCCIDQIRMQRDAQARPCDPAGSKDGFQEYRRGLYNGLECALATLESRESQYEDEPISAGRETRSEPIVVDVLQEPDGKYRAIPRGLDVKNKHGIDATGKGAVGDLLFKLTSDVAVPGGWPNIAVNFCTQPRTDWPVVYDTAMQAHPIPERESREPQPTLTDEMVDAIAGRMLSKFLDTPIQELLRMPKGGVDTHSAPR